MAYKSYDKSVDYADRLERMMRAGASAAEVEGVLRQRINKATTEPGYEPYAYDEHYAAARDYIDRNTRYPAYDRAYTAQSVYEGGRQTNPYADQLEDALGRLQTREPFSYDPESDPAFQAYRAAYRREGERAAKNSLGDAAALTGGQASTAAVTAASQARDYYNSKLNDVVPRLYQMAWNMYQGEQSDLMEEIRLLEGLSERAYAQDKDQRALDYQIFTGERAFAYGQYQDVLDREQDASDSWYDRTYAYDKLNQNAQQYEQTRAANSEKHAYDRAMAFLKAGVMPTDQMLRAANIDKETARSLRASALRKQN